MNQFILILGDRIYKIVYKLFLNYIDTENSDEFDELIKNKSFKNFLAIEITFKINQKKGNLEQIKEEFIKLKEENLN